MYTLGRFELASALTIDCSFVIRISAEVSFLLSQSTRLNDRLMDRQTDKRTERPWQYRALHYTQSHGKNLNIIRAENRRGVVGILCYQCNLHWWLRWMMRLTIVTMVPWNLTSHLWHFQCLDSSFLTGDSKDFIMHSVRPTVQYVIWGLHKKA